MKTHSLTSSAVLALIALLVMLLPGVTSRIDAQGTDARILLGAANSSLQAPSSATFFDEWDPHVQYNGWYGVMDAKAIGGSYRASTTANDTATYKFVGTSIKWIYRTGPDEGNAQVLIDGVNKGIINLYSPTPVYQVSKQYTGLSKSLHIIIIKVLGTHAPASSGNKVVIDALGLVDLGTVDSTTLAIQWDKWLGASSKGAAGGEYRYGSRVGDRVIFRFTGTAVTWLTFTGKPYGKAEVFIDNADKGTVDLYSSPSEITYSGLTAGPHTLRIQVLHTKNRAASGYQVVVDAFSVTP